MSPWTWAFRGPMRIFDGWEDELWCSYVPMPFELKPMTREEEQKIGGLYNKDGEIWWLPPKK